MFKVVERVWQCVYASFYRQEDEMQAVNKKFEDSLAYYRK